MPKERRSFYCFGHHCGYIKHPIDDIADELNGKKLCKKCYDYGLRLKIGVIVVRAKEKG
jgi:hypothetical protein